MALVNFKNGTKSGLDNAAIENGTIYVITDTQEIYADLNGKRHNLGKTTDLSVVSAKLAELGEKDTSLESRIKALEDAPAGGGDEGKSKVTGTSDASGTLYLTYGNEFVGNNKSTTEDSLYHFNTTADAKRHYLDSSGLYFTNTGVIAKTFYGKLGDSDGTTRGAVYNVGNNSTPVYFEDGIPKACTSAGGGTDEKVKMDYDLTTDDYLPLLFAPDTFNKVYGKTNTARVNSSISVNPSKGSIKAEYLYGRLGDYQGNSIYNVGSANSPVYFKGGVPTECSSIAASVQIGYSGTDSSGSGASKNLAVAFLDNTTAGIGTGTSTIYKAGYGPTPAGQTNLTMNSGTGTLNFRGKLVVHETTNYSGSAVIAAKNGVFGPLGGVNTAGNGGTLYNVGGPSTPVYFVNGVPTACTSAYSADTRAMLAVPYLADFNDLVERVEALEQANTSLLQANASLKAQNASLIADIQAGKTKRVYENANFNEEEYLAVQETDRQLAVEVEEQTLETVESVEQTWEVPENEEF